MSPPQLPIALREGGLVSVGPSIGWEFIVALVALLAIGVGASHVGRVGIGRDITIAAVRAVGQLTVAAVLIAAVLDHLWASLLFAVGMLAVAVVTAGGRIDARRCWRWTGLAIGGAAVPVLAVIFATAATAFTGPAIVAIGGIVIGGTMMAHSLTARRAFDALRDEKGQVEAGLALGMQRRDAIANVIGRHARDAVLPAIDQTRTVGLVTLPGAFIGVLLGGGSPRDAAASQVLVLVGLLAAETLVVAISHRLIAEGRLLPADVRESMPPF